MRTHLVVALVLAGPALLAPTARAAWPHDPFANVRVAPISATQYPGAVVPDGAGGAIIVWNDQRSGALDIYAQHFTALGAIAPGWPANGLAVCTAAGDQYGPVAASDGSGGAILAWGDARLGAGLGDIYAMRVNGNGTLGAGWPANGRSLSGGSPAGKDEIFPVIVSDGAGGAIVTWTLVFTVGTDWDVYAGRVNAAGAVQWATPVAAPSAMQYGQDICSDGAGGAIITYEDDFAGNYDIKAARVTAGGGLPWGTVGVCLQGATQLYPAIASDGAGGATIAWTDYRNNPGAGDIYAAHLTATGLPVPGWTADGNPVCLDPGDQNVPVIVSDGGSGAIIAWSDYRVAGPGAYASRITIAGGPAPGWAANGTAAFTSPFGVITMLSDDAGGAIIAWTDHRGPGFDIWAVRLKPWGTFAPGWSNGVPVSLAASDQVTPRIGSDGAGGAILAWSDYRSNTSFAYAQHIDRFAQLGSPEPSITRVKDLPGDQGGQLRLDWSASYLDADPLYGISAYWIWRQAPLSLATQAVANGARWLDADLATRMRAMGTGERESLGGLYMPDGANAAYAWEFVTTRPAIGFGTYSYVAETTRDSLPSSNPYTVFMVQALAPANAYWNSAPDSGYSVDNLGPAMPAPIAGAFVAGQTHVHWGANHESDLAGYRLYRGASPGFVPGPGSLVSAQPDTGFADNAPFVNYYKLSAVDIHGNESPFALLAPGGTTSAPPGDLPRELALSLASANPAHGAAALRLALPRESRVDLSVFDVNGRRIRALVRGELPAGEHALRWDGRDEAGVRAASGLYFLRLDTPGQTLKLRLVMAN